VVRCGVGEELECPLGGLPARRDLGDETCVQRFLGVESLAEQ
jgi:hypothetical protein